MFPIPPLLCPFLASATVRVFACCPLRIPTIQQRDHVRLHTTILACFVQQQPFESCFGCLDRQPRPISSEDVKTPAPWSAVSPCICVTFASSAALAGPSPLLCVSFASVYVVNGHKISRMALT
ncbi:hypothetical protein IWX49DRAFT_322662 [Phyllosticta citricarpa]|uniref:Secreted protein n=2 Tax=Phyllosticta TaxID=121621 RepID=A0ABR1M3R7_9PEZI